VKSLFKLKNIPVILLVVYIAKSFIVSPELFDFGVIVLMGILFHKRLSNDDQQNIENASILKELQTLKEELDEQKQNYEEQSEELKSKVSAINLMYQNNSKLGSEKSKFSWG
jgi:hypothetical protein